MPQITYSLGETGFDAVPENLIDNLSLAIAGEATLNRSIIYTIGAAVETVVLKGRYMTAATRDAILGLFSQCRSTGERISFNDGYTDRDVLIRSFETVPLIGATGGYSFQIELIIVG
jgi:hypothetical protein